MMNDPNDMHRDDKKNLIIFIVSAMVIWFSFDHFLLKPRMEALREHQKVEAEAATAATTGADAVTAERPRDEVVGESLRLRIDNGAVFGSVALTGGRIDDLSLQNYYKTHDRVDHVQLLSPSGTPYPKYAEFGWLSSDKNVRVPGKDTVWQVANGTATLTKDTPVTLFWDNGAGLRFERDIAVDDQFLFTIKQRVINNSGRSVTLNPYAIISEHGIPEDLYKSSVVHEGPIGYIDGKLIEHSYQKMKKQRLEDITVRKGWIGITQNYWLTAFVPDQSQETRFRFLFTPAQNAQDKDRYQVDAMASAQTIAPGAQAESVTHAYLGAKKGDLISKYEKQLGSNHLDLAVDYGMYYFLTKPFYYILHQFGHFAGNFGLGIIMLTILVRACVFPLANTSFKSFAQLKKISPRMHELRDKYGDDKQKLQQELVKLYEKEKVNPMAGCLPIIFQIPIFFALYKVLQISIEMRHAPFYGWVHDLSAPDPTTVFNLFGLIPWTPPAFIPMIGAWPCLMLIFMIIQKKMNPPPQDKTQAMMINFMPYLMTYILASFPAGLVIYWTFGNALSVLQQYVIMRNMGVEVHWFKRTEKDAAMAEKVAEGPTVHPELEVLEHQVEKAMTGEENPVTVSPPKKKKNKKKK